MISPSENDGERVWNLEIGCLGKMLSANTEIDDAKRLELQILIAHVERLEVIAESGLVMNLFLEIIAEAAVKLADAVASFVENYT